MDKVMDYSIFFVHVQTRGFFFPQKWPNSLDKHLLSDMHERIDHWSSDPLFVDLWIEACLNQHIWYNAESAYTPAQQASIFAKQLLYVAYSNDGTLRRNLITDALNLRAEMQNERYFSFQQIQDIMRKPNTFTTSICGLQDAWISLLFLDLTKQIPTEAIVIPDDPEREEFQDKIEFHIDNFVILLRSFLLGVGAAAKEHSELLKVLPPYYGKVLTRKKTGKLDQWDKIRNIHTDIALLWLFIGNILKELTQQNSNALVHVFARIQEWSFSQNLQHDAEDLLKEYPVFSVRMQRIGFFLSNIGLRLWHSALRMPWRLFEDVYQHILTVGLNLLPGNSIFFVELSNETIMDACLPLSILPPEFYGISIAEVFDGSSSTYANICELAMIACQSKSHLFRTCTMPWNNKMNKLLISDDLQKRIISFQESWMVSNSDLVEMNKKFSKSLAESETENINHLLENYFAQL